MSFNYNLEKKLFDREWIKKEKLMIDAGMSKEDIEKIFEFDWCWFKNNRRYIDNTLDIYDMKIIVDENTTDFDEGLDLLNQINDAELFKAISRLKPDQIDILIKLAIEDKSQIDVASELNLTKRALNNRIRLIKEKLVKFLN